MESFFLNGPSSLILDDLKHVWHPFTQAKTARFPIPITKGEGVYLYAEQGTRYLDGISSWWVNLHGHAHPYIVEKIKAQLDRLEHVIFADFTHPPAVELAKRLVQILPGDFSKVFYTDNGSTSVEAALKIALQYNYQQISEKKSKIVCFRGGYHGDTFGAMSAAGKNALNQPFWKQLFEVEMIDPPWENETDKSLSQLMQILEKGESAAFIFEPLVLGSGGMRIYSAQGLDLLLDACRHFNVLTIADEVMTGFGRTGPLFACEHLLNRIDIICLSKGLTGGFLPLGVTACTQKIYDAFLSDQLSKAFLHGHSYTANPLACTAALASLDLLLDESCTLQRNRIAKSHQLFVERYKTHPRLKRCESLGTLLVLEYHAVEGASYFQPMRDSLYHFFLDHQILLRPLGNVLYILPPYCIQYAELENIYEHILLNLEENS